MSNAVIENIKTRRSCRKFTSDPVPAELVDQIVEAGLWAPSGMGKQGPIILKITNPELREQFRQANCEIFGGKEGFDPFYGAPVILAVLAPADLWTGVEDGSLVMQNLMLAAHSLGLGSIWIHRAKEEFERPEFQQLLKDAGVEGEWRGVGHCAIGYAAEGGEGAATPRKEGRVISFD